MSEHRQIELPTSDEPVAAEAVPHPAPVPSPSPGAQLRAAREAAGISVADAAQAIRLSARQIGLLESDSWEQLPGETFVRGFLRNYARLLKIDPEPLLATVSAATPQPIELPEGSHEEMPAEGSSASQVVPMVAGGGLLLVAAIAAYFFWPATPASRPAVAPPPLTIPNEPVQATPAAAEPTPPVASAGDPVVAAPAAEPAGSATTSPATVAELPVRVVDKPAPVIRATEPASPTASAAKPAESSAAPVEPRPFVVVDGPQRALRITVRELSWVEVHDAGGNTLIAYNFEAGTVRNVRGVAPLEVVVGNAAGVDLDVDGKTVDLTAQARANVAKLTVK